MDNIIDSAFEAVEPEAVETEVAPTEQTETPQDETTEQEEKRLTEAEWMKKRRNVVSRRDKQISKLRAQYEAAQEELQKYRTTPSPAAVTQNDDRPKETDYPTYHEFSEAVQDWKLDRARKEWERQSKVAQDNGVKSYQEQQFISQSDNALKQATMEYSKIVPNIEEIIHEHGQTIASFPSDIKRVIREVDPQDVVKAFHAMVENDTLEDLADMTPTQAATAIVRAASMHQRAVPITKAPAPLSSAKGTGQGQKTLNRMSPDELVAWVNS